MGLLNSRIEYFIVYKVKQAIVYNCIHLKKQLVYNCKQESRRYKYTSMENIQNTGNCILINFISISYDYLIEVIV